MKKQLLIGLILLAQFLYAKSQQWDATIDPVWTNSRIGIGNNNPESKLGVIGFVVSGTSHNGIDFKGTGSSPANGHGWFGIKSEVELSSYADDKLYGFYSLVSKTNNSGGAGYMYSYYASHKVSSDKKVTYGFGYYAKPEIEGTLENYYGVKLDANKGSGIINNKWGVYQSDSEYNNYFAGNIGIGIEPSNCRLEVKGGDSKFDSDYKVYIPSVGSSYFWRGNTDGVDNLKLSVWYKFGIYNPTSGGINTYNSDWNIRFCARNGTIETKGSGYFALTSGNVGIGTTNTGTHKLAVEGTIGAREIKVEAQGWSDFVFHPTYNLRPLQEVNAYIQQNGHLPEIPTAKEVEENGVSLGEMNAKLLQKIEELTLYTIEQQKQINEQYELINQLNTEIQNLK